MTKQVDKKKLAFIICSQVNSDSIDCERDWCNRSCGFRLPRIDEAVTKISAYYEGVIRGIFEEINIGYYTGLHSYTIPQKEFQTLKSKYLGDTN